MRDAIPKIRVSEYESRDYSVFCVYDHDRCWKRLRPIKGNADAVWYEFRADLEYRSVSKEQEEVLHNVWKQRDKYPRVRRYAREDGRGARLLSNLATAFSKGEAESVQRYLSEFITHTGKATQKSIHLALSWDTLPRFDPSLVKKTRWVVDSFLVDGGIQLVFGERGSFKSTLLLFTAKAVANKEKLFGLKTRRCRVLYLDYENPANIIKSRNDDLELNLPNNPYLVIWNRFTQFPVPRPSDPALQVFVKSCLSETGHGPWIIFDSWSSLLNPGEGGENTGQIAPIYSHLRTLADLGATITILDHSRKYNADVIYGGQDKEAKSDTIHNLQIFDNPIQPQNAIVRVESWLKRFAPRTVGTFAFEVQSIKDNNGEWHVSGLKPAKDPIEEQKRKKREFVRDLIRDNPDCSQQELTKLAAKKDLARDETVKILHSGVGKYWTVEKSAHGKRCYRILEASTP
jgi:hypothetical protein